MKNNNLDLFRLSGHEFEALIEKLVRKMGFITKERKLTADGGIDILAISSMPMFEGKYVIQCKRCSSPVGASILRDLYGVVHSENANKGILITTSSFTKAAIDFAKDKQLELIDGEKLKTLLSKYGLFKAEIQPISIPDSIRVLIDTFVSPMKLIKERVNDIKYERVYVERKIFSLKSWENHINTQLHRLKAYTVSVVNIINLSLAPNLLSREPDLDKIRKDSKKILDATRKIVKDYERTKGIVAPEFRRKPHDRFLEIYDSIFDTIFTFTDKIENVVSDPKRQVYEITLFFDIDKEVQEFIKALNRSKRACFIATAAYGTSMAEEISILRRFRDHTLERSSFGKKIVVLYYRVSPPLAKLISKSNLKRKIVRKFLEFFITFLKKKYSKCTLHLID